MVLLKRKKTWNMLLDKSIFTIESIKLNWFKFYKPDIYKFIQDNTISLMPDNFDILVSKFEELKFWWKVFAIESTQKDYEDKLNECDALTRKAILHNTPVIKNPLLIIPMDVSFEKVKKIDYAISFSYLVLEDGKYIPYQLSQSTSSSGKIVLEKQYTESEVYDMLYKNALSAVFSEKIPQSENECNNYLKKTGATEILFNNNPLYAYNKYYNNAIIGALYNLAIGDQAQANDEVLQKINFDVAKWFYLNAKYKKDISQKIKNDSYLNYFRPSILLNTTTSWETPSFKKIYSDIVKETEDFYKQNMFYLVSRWELVPPQIALQQKKDIEMGFDKVIETIVWSLYFITEEEFNKYYPFIKKDDMDIPYITDSYLNYYGAEAPEWHLTNIPRMWKSKQVARLLYEEKITNINQLTEPLVFKYFWDYDTLSKTDYGRYILQVLKKEEQSFNLPAIKSIIESNYFWKHLFFYDYETISSAFPVLEGTRIFDQAVAQYSCHYLNKNWEVKHSEYLLNKDEKNYFWLLKHFTNFVMNSVADNDFDNVRFVVWNASFEMARNNEMIQTLENIQKLNLFSTYGISEKEVSTLIKMLLLINSRTIDLADFFKNRYVYYKKLEGKWSLKNVFPLYSDKLSYNNLNIQKGDVAATKIFDMLVGNIKDPVAIEKIRKDLLEYCGLDTLSMVIIYADIANKAWCKVNLNFK